MELFELICEGHFRILRRLNDALIVFAAAGPMVHGPHAEAEISLNLFANSDESYQDSSLKALRRFDTFECNREEIFRKL